MKHFHILSAAAVFFMAASCGPSSYMMTLEVPGASVAGVDITGRSLAVMYVDKDSTTLKSCFTKSFSEGLSYSLHSSVPQAGEAYVYRVQAEEGKDYSSRESMVEQAVAVNADVVMLVQEGDFPEREDKGEQCSMNLSVYDTMDSTDNVYTYRADCKFPASMSGKNLAKIASLEGERVAKVFHPQWKSVEYPVVYYPSGKWEDAVRYCDNFEWKKAIDIWMQFVGSDNSLKRSCAAYNIAVACYFSGEKELAAEWLEASDKACQLSVSGKLRALMSKGIVK